MMAVLEDLVVSVLVIPVGMIAMDENLATMVVITTAATTLAEIMEVMEDATLIAEKIRIVIATAEEVEEDMTQDQMIRLTVAQNILLRRNLAVVRTIVTDLHGMTMNLVLRIVLMITLRKKRKLRYPPVRKQQQHLKRALVGN